MIVLFDHHLTVCVLDTVVDESSMLLKASFPGFGSCIDATPLPSIPAGEIVHVASFVLLQILCFSSLSK